MKMPKRHIKIVEGCTTAVYDYKIPADDGTIYTRGVIIIHHPLNPVLFRKARRVGRQPFEGRAS